MEATSETKETNRRLVEANTTWRLVSHVWKNVCCCCIYYTCNRRIYRVSVFFGALTERLSNAQCGTSLKSKVVYDLWEEKELLKSIYGAHCLKPTYAVLTSSFQAKKLLKRVFFTSQRANTTHTLSLHSHSNAYSFKPKSYSNTYSFKQINQYNVYSFKPISQ